MKKFIIIASAGLLFGAAFVSCEKTSIDAPEKEISFQVANYLETRAAGAKYENGPFGTYSWYGGSDALMVNEQVDLSGGVWKTVDHTYYWPKTGSIDFISYSPFMGASGVEGDNPTVTTNSITFNDFEASDVDLMVADKVTCSTNVDEITDDADGTTDSGYNGVPTMFRHTLSKIGFKVKANFLEWTEGEQTTTWKVTVNSITLNNIFSKGSMTLTWDDEAGAWQAPEDSVWTISLYNNETTSAELVDTPLELTTELQDLAAVNNYIIPQTLLPNMQSIRLKCSIHTDLSTGRTLDEEYDSGDMPLVNISSIEAWKMNQNILYIINIKPTATTDPDTPGHNNDTPEDVTITYDPAVDGWETVQTGITIQL